MRRRTLIATSVMGILLLMSETVPAEPKSDPENTLYMDLKDGRVVIELLPDLAPAAGRADALRSEAAVNRPDCPNCGHAPILAEMRGLDIIASAVLAAAIGDPSRFATAPHFMAYLGMVPFMLAPC